MCRFRERADHALEPPPPLPQAPSPVSEKCNSLCWALVESKGWAPSFLNLYRNEALLEKGDFEEQKC